MLASKYFNIEHTDSDDWFDPILDADTELFADPFLIFKEEEGQWSKAHSRIIEHFNKAFLLIASSNLNEHSLSYQKALHLLTFKEPKELCLGYTGLGTGGSGGGIVLARAVAQSAVDAIGRGLESPPHFEELGILNKGVGRDLISDITCTIIKPLLIEYTQEICNNKGIPMELQGLFANGFDENRLRWISGTVMLPKNPYTDSPLLLIPEKFLNNLPALNANSWWDHYQNEMLRQDINYEIIRKVDKERIIQVAREHREQVRNWTTETESQEVKPYDLKRDPEGVYQWDAKTTAFVEENPLVLNPANNEREFIEVINKVIAQFKHFIEEEGGWYLLWDTNKEKDEKAAQLIFRGLGVRYCRANNIVLDAEVNFGRGPVDFKFSNGYTLRAHLEIKKLHHGQFWNGLAKQLPSYMRSDEVRLGWFLCLQYRDEGVSVSRLRKLPGKVAAVATELELNLNLAIVNCLPKESASNL